MKKLLIFSAPSGAGKTTIVKHLLDSFPQLSFSISATSRQQRSNEQEGVHYYFLTEKDFRQKIAAGEFVEWEEVYPHQFYGTLKTEVERIWSTDKVVVFDVDVIGGLNIKEIYGNRARAVFIQPPSHKTPRKKAEAEGTENEASIKKRVAKAEKEITYGNRFDDIIINDNLERAKEEASQIVKDHLNL